MTEKNHFDHHHLIYLKGFLDSISYINTFDNDGKSYLIEILEKVNDNFQDTIQKRFKVKNWKITTELVASDWKLFLKKESRPYFDQIIGEVFQKTNKDLIYDEKGHYRKNADQLIENVKQDSRFYIDHLLQEKFIEALEKIVSENPVLYKVEVDWHISDEGWYEMYYNDIIFDLDDHILFLHFGASD